MKTDLLILSDKTTSATSPQNLIKILDYANTLTTIFDTIHIMTVLDYSRCTSIAIPDNIKLHLIDEWSPTSGIMRIFAHIKFLWKLIFKSIIFLKREPQIRTVANPYGHYLIGVPLLLVAKLTGRKLLIRIACDIKSGILTAYERFGSIGGFIFKAVFKNSERLVLTQADAIISVSPIFLDDYPQYAGKTTVTTKYYPVVDRQKDRYLGKTKVKHSTNDQDILTALFVGRLAPGKGLSILLDALSQTSGIHCRIVGDGELKDSLKNQAELLNLRDKVTFAGALRQEHVYQEMEQADLLVLPSLSEYIPSVVIEAAAMGTPSIATDVGGVRYFVKNNDTGLLCIPGDPESLRVAIETMKQDEERIEWGYKAHKLASAMFSRISIDTNVRNIQKSLTDDLLD